MAISAAFTINSTAVPAAVSVAYGATVTLVLTSITGVESVAFTIEGTSKSGVSAPTLTPSGSPSGSTATFTMPSDPGDGLGRSYLVKCTVSNSYETQTAYGIVGAVNDAGLVPLAAGETTARSATHGWLDTVNTLLKVGGDRMAINAQTGTSYTLVLTDAGRLVTLTNASAITLTIPANSTAAFPVGTVIQLAQRGAGQVTTSPAGGVTRNAFGGATKLAGQYAYATLTKIATDTWDLAGTVV
jgi:hypothetical protein